MSSPLPRQLAQLKSIEYKTQMANSDRIYRPRKSSPAGDKGMQNILQLSRLFELSMELEKHKIFEQCPDISSQDLTDRAGKALRGDSKSAAQI